MESSKIISTEKATVVIQVNPQLTQNTFASDDGQEGRGSYHYMALKEFFKAQPKALGTVQIMTGVIFFSFGIVLTTNDDFRYPYPHLSVFSGITYWGSLVYISAGSLSVAAQNKLHACVVKASLIMNVLSAITAVAAITLMSMDLFLVVHHHCYYYSDCGNIKRYNLGIRGILLVFSILQFIISICISGFACKVTCNSNSAVVNVALNQA
ncbi:membrane-spanning 4-domains subfamily A member 4A-like [Danio aesculapii]|uniref:membrane-spanning 4-domains subfamily A member 4A-like n=1 Tax=Danio aesculapii TaxID=1142201 RepID=UPI0024BFD535|nr:membrane-spanning 4-domains subfamily A member 4A-like [Danio aesculapii]